MMKSDALVKIDRQLSQIDQLKRLEPFSTEFKEWWRNTQTTLRRVFGEDSARLKDFNSIEFSLTAFSSNTPDSEFTRAFHRGLESAKACLRSATAEVNEYWEVDNTTEAIVDAQARVEKLCSRFHIVASQLRDRHDARETLEVEDEYDVQDLLHALLRVDFDDVRAEEWTPSYAGGASRQDFLLKDHKLVIEAKKSRKGLTAKEVGEQLLVDIARYRVHPDCKTLICLVYDPEGRVKNPTGLENDLKLAGVDFPVRVLVVPKGV